MLNLLAVRNVCDLLAYSFSSMSTMVFPLSACVTIAFPLVSFLFNSFVIYNCLFWCGFVRLVVLMICFIFFAAKKRYGFCNFSSRSLIACSVSVMRLAAYDVVGLSML